jgi:hypothetical protein
MYCIDTVHTVHPCATTQEIAPEKQNCSVQIPSNYPDPETRENLESQKTVTRRMQAKPQKDIIKPENFGPNAYVMSLYCIHALSVIVKCTSTLSQEQDCWHPVINL